MQISWMFLHSLAIALLFVFIEFNFAILYLVYFCQLLLVLFCHLFMRFFFIPNHSIIPYVAFSLCVDKFDDCYCYFWIFVYYLMCDCYSVTFLLLFCFYGHFYVVFYRAHFTLICSFPSIIFKALHVCSALSFLFITLLLLLFLCCHDFMALYFRILITLFPVVSTFIITIIQLKLSTLQCANWKF